MNALKQSTLYSTYAALVLMGLNYHYGTPFIHLAAITGTFFILINFFRFYDYSTLSFVEISWVSALFLWPFAYFLGSLTLDEWVYLRALSNLLKSTIVFVPIYLTLRECKIKRHEMYVAILLCSFGGSLSSYFNYFVHAQSEEAYWSMGSINFSVIFAAILAMQISAVMVVALDYIYCKQKILASVAVFLAVFGIGALCLTGSRGAFLAILPVVCIFAVYLLRQAKKKFYIAASLLLSLLLFTPLMVASPLFQKLVLRFEGTTLSGILGPRFYLWSAILDALKNNYFIGGGFSTSEEVISAYAEKKGFSGGYEGLTHAHNDFLQTAFDFGLPLAAILFFFLFFSGGWSAKLYFSRNHPRFSLLLTALVALSFFVSGLTDVVILQAPSMVMMVIFMTLTLSFNRKQFSSCV